MQDRPNEQRRTLLPPGVTAVPGLAIVPAREVKEALDSGDFDDLMRVLRRGVAKAIATGDAQLRDPMIRTHRKIVLLRALFQYREDARVRGESEYARVEAMHDPATNLSKAAVRRLLEDLEETGYIERVGGEPATADNAVAWRFALPEWFAEGEAYDAMLRNLGG